MNETPRAEAPIPRRRRWRILLALALVLLLTLTAAIVWQKSRNALSDEEQHLVGTWTVQPLSTTMSTTLLYEFRPDRTCRIRTVDPKTGALISDRTNARWWLSGNRLTVHHPGTATSSFWHVLPSQRSADEVLILTPDGPDRFRYTGTIEIRGTPTQPSVTGTMTRVTPTE